MPTGAVAVLHPALGRGPPTPDNHRPGKVEDGSRLPPRMTRTRSAQGTGGVLSMIDGKPRNGRITHH